MDVTVSQREFENSPTKYFQRENNYRLNLESLPVFDRCLQVHDVVHCYHISCQAPDSLSLSYRGNLVVRMSTEQIPLSFNELYPGYGIHTFNIESELIYIDRIYNINKISNDMKSITPFVPFSRNNRCSPRCVFSSPYTGDLLVGFSLKDSLVDASRLFNRSGYIARFNQFGHLTQVIEHTQRGLKLYRLPHYITENNNGDVVVSDFPGAVVVTDGKGRHRFTYTGYPEGSKLNPRGICTDLLSRILVCDNITYTIQFLNKDGQFLSYFKTPEGLGSPYSLCYDVKAHLLYVGSLSNNFLSVYRCHIQQESSTGTSN